MRAQNSYDSVAGVNGTSALADFVAPKTPVARFRCLLDEQPSSLVPRHLVTENRKRHHRRQLVVNPHCCFSRDCLIGMPFLDRPSSDEEMVWLLDPATGGVLPFWLGPVFRSLLAHVSAGEAEPPGLPSDARFALAMAGVLVESDYAARRSREYASMVGRCAPQFRKRGYVPVQGLIHPFHLGALRSYYRQLIHEGKLELGDGQSSRRYFAHNEKIAAFFHHQLTAVVSAIAGEPVKPSYVYVASYQGGARLPKHRDREQCEYSLSLCIDFTPEPAGRSPWPLCLETREGTEKIFQSTGEALLYRGCQLPHYRTVLPKNCISTSMFFHYVHRDFAGPLD